MNTYWWARTLGFLDYHHKKWYTFRDGKWQKVNEQSVHDELRRCGCDVNEVVKQFRDRDKYARARKL
jgi:hypothetical protein